MTTQPETIEANATLVAEDAKELLAVVSQNNLQTDTAQGLQSKFGPLFIQARSVIEKSRDIVVTDANQKLEIKMARACRLELKTIRVSAEKVRKDLKEEYLRGGRAVDGFNSILLHLTETEEKRLQEQEDFAELQEQRRKAALKEVREKVLIGIQVDPNLYALAEMEEGTFQQLVEGTKLARAAEAERNRKAEAERIERDAKEQAERERIRLENERLKREAEERAAAEKAEKDRRATLHKTRQEIMKRFVESGDESHNAQYGDLTDDQFGETLAGAQNRWAARLKLEKERAEVEEKARVERELAAAAAKAERERVEAEKVEAARVAAVELQRREALATEERRKAEKTAAEIRRVAEENARIEAEKARKERLRLQALAEVERQKAESEKKAREELEAKAAEEKRLNDERIAAEREAARKAAAAPDRDRLLTYANAIRALEIPTFATPEAQVIGQLVASQRDKFVKWLETKTEAL